MYTHASVCATNPSCCLAEEEAEGEFPLHFVLVPPAALGAGTLLAAMLVSHFSKLKCAPKAVHRFLANPAPLSTLVSSFEKMVGDLPYREAIRYTKDNKKLTAGMVLYSWCYMYLNGSIVLC